MEKRYCQIIIPIRVSAYPRIVEPASSEPKSERRRSQRTPVLVPALIMVGEDRHAARVMDLSTTGALLGSAVQLDAGESVTFTCGTIETAAVVVWRDGRVLGVTFPVELGRDEVRRQVDRTAAVQSYVSQHKQRSCSDDRQGADSR